MAAAAADYAVECFICTESEPRPHRSACLCTDRYMHTDCFVKMLKAQKGAPKCGVCGALYEDVGWRTKRVPQFISPCGAVVLLACSAIALTGCATTPSFDAPRFAPFQPDLRAYAERQREQMGIPGVWIALLEVDPETGTEHLWADHLGEPVHSDPSRHRQQVVATHRVASISKLLTDTAAMALVEQGALDLDEPIQTYLPDFAPEDPYGVPITLRLLMGHRAGLVREPPVGHYFDPGEPSLAATVRSLNRTKLVHKPGTEFKYSNPGVGVVGEVVSRVTAKPFESAVRELVLDPLGLRDSDFAPRGDLVARQAAGIMWTYDGREIPTPSWRFGYVPAAELRSTTVDLVRFARSWFPGAACRVLSPEVQASMWAPPNGASRGCALGFFLSSLDGHRKVAHGGAVYGFASTLAALPEQGLAVAVVCTKDFANDVAEAIADRALRAALANRRGETLAPPASAAAMPSIDPPFSGVPG